MSQNCINTGLVTGKKVLQNNIKIKYAQSKFEPSPTAKNFISSSVIDLKNWNLNVIQKQET